MRIFFTFLFLATLGVTVAPARAQFPLPLEIEINRWGLDSEWGLKTVQPAVVWKEKVVESPATIPPATFHVQQFSQFRDCTLAVHFSALLESISMPRISIATRYQRESD